MEEAKEEGVVSEGNENKSPLPRSSSAVQNPNPHIIHGLNIDHSTITRTDQSQI